jgi:SAM-dependent methyltransferase
MPADWELPAGVSRGLWEYCHDPANARGYDASLTGTPLVTIDEAFVLEHCKPPGRIIDLGAGTGRLSLALAQSGYQPVAVDLSPHMLAVLREKAAVLGLDVPCVCANLVDLGAFADASFDHAACLFGTLGLILGAEPRRRMLAHVRRILKPGGVFVLHVHNRWFNLWTGQGRHLLWQNWLDSWNGQSTPGDFEMPAQQGVGILTMHLFTRAEIVGLLEEAGLEMIEARPLSLASDGRLRCPWWFPGFRSYGYLLASRKR